MKTINEFFVEMIENQVRNSKWYRSIPTEYRKDVSIQVVGIEYRLFSSFTSSSERPCFVIHCKCLDDHQDYIMLIDDTNIIEPVQN
jgi:hypothetical protein